MELPAMYRHILLPTDGSALSEAAIQYGVAVAKSVGAKVTGITVIMPFHVFAIDSDLLTLESYEPRAKKLARQYLMQVRNAAAQAGVKCETIEVEDEHPYRAIIDTAKNRGCDLIVMASHGRRGVSAVVLGSETVKVLTHSSIPVLVYRAESWSLAPKSFAAS
jgi:nucleotide-binding universal stress UspA family protein